MTEEELKAQPWTVERAIGTIGAFIEGGDELGLVSEEEATTAYNVLCDALAAVTAERDALKAWRDAVPVKEIKYYVGNTEPEIDLMMYWEDNQPVFDKAKYAIINWLKTQVTP